MQYKVVFYFKLRYILSASTYFSNASKPFEVRLNSVFG